MNKIIEAIELHKSYDSLEVLRGVSMAVFESEVLVITGASGAGKSTLLHIIGSLDKADQGKVLFRNENINSLEGKKLATFRNRKTGFVFQAHHLLPEFTALENVMMPSLIGGVNKNEASEKASHLLKLVGLNERKDHIPSALSGGEQQRIAVARALINNPEIVFADEPSGNLDSANAENLHQLFFELKNKLNLTFVIVTHNEGLAKMADRHLHMKDGKISL